MVSLKALECIRHQDGDSVKLMPWFISCAN